LSDIKTAETNLVLAKIDLQKYLEGDYLQSKKDIEGRIAIAKSDLEMWEERAAWSARMSKRNYVTASQAQADAARLQSAKLALQKVEEELRVLENPQYGLKKRSTTDFQSKIDEAERALDRVKKQAVAKEAQPTPTARPSSPSTPRSSPSTARSRKKSASASSRRRRTAWWSTTCRNRTASAR